MSKKKISPLATIILATVIFSAGLGLAAWYWSRTLTYTMSIEGTIIATTNFAPEDLIGITTYTELETASVTEILEFQGHKHIIRVASGGGNPSDVYVTLEVTLPGSSICIAEVACAPFTNGVIGTGSGLVPIVTDGTESYQIIYNSNPTWFLESDYANGVVNVVYFILDITWDPSLPIGTHDVTATVQIGDTL